MVTPPLNTVAGTTNGPTSISKCLTTRIQGIWANISITMHTHSRTRTLTVTGLVMGSLRELPHLPQCRDPESTRIALLRPSTLPFPWLALRNTRMLPSYMDPPMATELEHTRPPPKADDPLLREARTFRLKKGIKHDHHRPVTPLLTPNLPVRSEIPDLPLLLSSYHYPIETT